MKNKIIFLIGILLISINLSYGEDSTLKTYTGKMRPFFSKVFGENMATKLFGVPDKQYVMPSIPEISKDARNSNSLDESKVGKPIADKELKAKYDLRFITEVYDAVRNESVNQNDASKWMNALEQGGSREGVYHAIVLDEIYGGMENMETPVNNGAMEFTVKFMSRYLNMSIKKEALEGANFYRLKREMVKRTLDLVDAFVLQNKIDDMYLWYSIFSAELGKEYASVWQNKMRLIVDADFHYKWAHSVPFQFLKSEIIIKLHKIYNSMK